METRNSDFITAIRDVLRHRPGETATYTHIECKIGGSERAAMGIRTLTDWLKDHPQDSATYMFVNKVDHRAALDSVKLGKEAVTLDAAAQGKLFVTTYSSWARRAKAPGDNQGRLVIVMDMGFGVRTGEMALAATILLHNLQGLLRGDKSGTTVSWASVSYSDEALLLENSGRLVDGLVLPGFGEPRLCHQDRAHEKADGFWRPDNDWQSAAVDRIMEEVVKKETSPMAIAFVMSIGDAYLVTNDLITRSQCPRPTIHFIHPWTGSQALREAVASSQGFKIVWIDPEVSVVPAIHNLRAVVVAPVLDAYGFDINTASVVGQKVVCDLTTALASSIQGADSEGAAVHMVKGFSQAVPPWDRHVPGPREQAAGLNSASDRDFWYLSLATHAMSGNYAFPGLLSVVLPPRFPKLEEAQRRLGLWHLVDGSGPPPDVEPSSSRPKPELVGLVAKYAKLETNIHSLVLLAHAKGDYPVHVKHVLIDLAMLISQGPSSVFDHTGTAKGQRERRKAIQSLGRDAGFARHMCHKGLLWQSHTYLNFFRRLTSAETWGASGWASSRLNGVARYHVLEKVLDRISGWKKTLKIPMEDDTHTMSSKDVDLVEAILVSAFPFNLMMVNAEQAGHFGRDLTSEVILEEEAQGETVNWDPLRKEARESGQGLVMAIYSHLWMDTADGDRIVYRATGTTAISRSALSGLKYLGIDSFERLRPVIRPERRCLIPKGQSWSARQGDSSQGTTSTSDGQS